MTGLSREEMRELRNALAHECLSEIENGVPECDDSRLSYVSIQVDRDLWLAARHCPKPPFLDGWHNEQAAAEPKPPRHERVTAATPVIMVGEPGKPETWRPADGQGILFIPEEIWAQRKETT